MWARIDATTPRHTRSAASAAIAVGLLVLATPGGWTADVGFRLRLEVSSTGATHGMYWLSLPYRYTPPDVNSNGLDAEDLAQDLQPTNLTRPCTETPPSCAVVRVWRWDPSTGEYVSWTSGSTTGTPFALQPGVAYGIEVQEVDGHTLHLLDVVGAHESSLELSDSHTPDGVNMRWISIPPHLHIDWSHGIPGVLDAEDLGQAMGGPSHVFQIRRLNEVTGLYDNWVVGSAYGTPFEVDLTRAYAIDLTCGDLAGQCADCRWAWQPTTY